MIAILVAASGVLWAHAARDQQRSPSIATIDTYLTQHHFSGYILLERRGHVLLSKGYGMANTRAGRANTIRSTWLDTGTDRFITAVAILRLQDQHRLSVHDALCRYLTNCPRAWRPITIQQLLLDTSGLDSFDTLTGWGGVGAALAQCNALPAGTPGAITLQSNCNTLLLNTVIARVSGAPWSVAMQELVFDPAHMIDSGQLTNAALPATLVQGYSAGAPVSLGNVDDYYLPYSSVQDLERLDQALVSGHLLSGPALRALFTPYIGGGAVLNRYFVANGSNATRLASGYGNYLRAATQTAVQVADQPGSVAGVNLDNALSPQNGTIAIMTRNVESGPNPTDVLFGLASHLLWGKQTAAPVPSSTRSHQIAAYLMRARFSGYVYLERHGQTIFKRGFGTADAAAKLPNAAQTRWPAFAATRFFVALAIMKLQDQGKLSVHDKICSYISGCPAAWHPITIRELLLNASGIGSFDPFAPGVTLPQTMAACKAMPLVSPSGSSPSPWSDCNTFVLGAVIEKVTEKGWEAAMQDLVYGPAGMTETGLMTNTLKPPQVGQFYLKGVPSPELNYDGYYLPYTTVDDLVRLTHTLLAGELISQRSFDAVFAPVMHAGLGDPTSPLLGYEVVIRPATATTYKAVCVVCTNGGGEDVGVHAGFFMAAWVSPAAGAIKIEVNNDTGYFNPGDDDNAFDNFISKSLYGK